MVGRLLSFWDGLFSGAMLVSGRVIVLPSNRLPVLMTFGPRMIILWLKDNDVLWWQIKDFTHVTFLFHNSLISWTLGRYDSPRTSVANRSITVTFSLVSLQFEISDLFITHFFARESQETNSAYESFKNINWKGWAADQLGCSSNNYENILKHMFHIFEYSLIYLNTFLIPYLLVAGWVGKVPAVASLPSPSPSRAPLHLLNHRHIDLLPTSSHKLSTKP